ncbi:hypothetical protein [Vulgatibacter incomptus]|uniref:Uncharacterized protein n=1 Tax=Vulgatibacter incomptus TaxID=1391653 RepID=A0A0K1PA55_9BACT|nr:hypothetical protein [Vulgatibacter incomptus]AKU90418.1 hypothetical protein AKJ08_0805 [Vulgatibacter incomptus]
MGNLFGDDTNHQCYKRYTLTQPLAACEAGVEQSLPNVALGFDKRFFERDPQAAVVASVSGSSMVVEGPWNTPYTFTWFESLEDMFQPGDEIDVSGDLEWHVVVGPRFTVAQSSIGAFSPQTPGRPVEDGPEVDYVPTCQTSSSDPVWGVEATLGDDRVDVAQGTRGSIGEWEILFHGAISSPGSSTACLVAEGNFQAMVSAWRANDP